MDDQHTIDASEIEVPESSVRLPLDRPNTVKFADLVARWDEEFLEQLLQAAVQDHLEQLYNRRDEVDEQFEQYRQSSDGGEQA